MRATQVTPAALSQGNHAQARRSRRTSLIPRPPRLRASPSKIVQNPPGWPAFAGH